MEPTKLKLRDIVNARTSLEALDKQKPKDIKLGYAIAKSLAPIDDKLHAFQRVNNDLIMEFATVDEDDKITLHEGTKPWLDYDAKYQELLGQEEDIAIRRFSLQQLEDAGLELSIGDLHRLVFMISDE